MKSTETKRAETIEQDESNVLTLTEDVTCQLCAKTLPAGSRARFEQHIGFGCMEDCWKLA